MLAAKRYRGGMTVRGGISSSRYLLAAKIPRRYDGSRWHLVIPLLVSGI
ncbi:hypothetical protein ACJZL1_02650 [Wolbachia endosymbiont of Rhagoletis indifferens]